jgi:hypothetical protein
VDRRAAELQEIASFMAGRGATCCRPAYVGVVTGALPRREERARIAALKVELAADRDWLVDGALPRHRLPARRAKRQRRATE